ncbi:hypothetical protein SteCoe_14641 [Stentor coeruleus]|uniref:Uncharacterized protein n=1 Tax=Stentor coeruleus TaxID=5963 RepID=A0A1R2C5J3_9CILI|nr:hypothetical protein SteCoe_14641 [Stentor coeruleus]
MSMKLKINSRATLGELIEQQSPAKRSSLIRVHIKKKSSDKTISNFPKYNKVEVNHDVVVKETVVKCDEPAKTVRVKHRYHLDFGKKSDSNSPSKDYRALSARTKVFSSNQIVTKESYLHSKIRNSSRFTIRNLEILNFLRNKQKYFPKKIQITGKNA